MADARLDALEALARAVEAWAADYGVNVTIDLSDLREKLEVSMDYGTKKYTIPSPPEDIEEMADALLEAIKVAVLHTLRRLRDDSRRKRWRF
jgi:hypothetical protein